jgi:hypothetical protein
LAEKNPKIKYKIDNNDLPIEASQVDLGVTLTQGISWTEQTNKAARKAVGTLYLLKKMFPIYDQKWNLLYQCGVPFTRKTNFY